MWLAYAVAGMLSIGVADFSIALAGRRMERTREILSVSWLQHAVSWAGLACAVALLDEGSAGPRDYLLGIAAGVALGIGKPILFAGLSFATISIFAPITAVVSILVPVGFALALGEQPGAWALIGIALCLPAVVLVSRDGGVLRAFHLVEGLGHHQQRPGIARIQFVGPRAHAAGEVVILVLMQTAAVFQQPTHPRTVLAR